MKKIILSICTFCILTTSVAQQAIDISASISPAFPIGALSDYVGGGFGFIGAIQTDTKKHITLGGELVFHVLSDDGYSSNSFLGVSAYANHYFNSKYLIGRAPLKPYIGLGVGIYRSKYTDYFYGDDPSQTGLMFSPRVGIRMDVDRLFLAGEGRLHLSTGFADSYVPILITIGYRIGGQ